MAALVLGLAGSAIGGSTMVTGALGISAAMGASLGWSLGSMLGSMLGPKQKIEGPRLQDGKVQASTHGQVIPIIYGSYRTAGNIIDFSGMREHAKKERSKKAKTVMTTYSYECDVAVGICAGTIGGVRRIWANNELIYSVAEDADLATIQASNNAAGNIRIYTGSETQLPDPTLEALHGAGNVPAYRGLAYIVISRIWVEKYGNRLPNFEFEVVGGGAAGFYMPFLDVDSVYNRNNTLLTSSGDAYNYQIVGNNVQVSRVHPFKSSITSLIALPAIDDESGYDTVDLTTVGHDSRSDYFFVMRRVYPQIASVTRYAINCVDLTTFEVSANLLITSSPPTYWLQYTKIKQNGAFATIFNPDWYIGYEITQRKLTPFGEQYTEKVTSQTVLDIIGDSVYKNFDSYTADAYGGLVHIKAGRKLGHISPDGTASSDITINDVFPVSPPRHVMDEHIIDYIDGIVYIYYCRPSAGGGTPYIAKIVPNWGSGTYIIYYEEMLWNLVFLDDARLFGGARVLIGSGRFRFVFANSNERSTAPLAAILTDIAARVGVSPDVSEIPADLEVGGYAISRQMSARGAIEPLQNAYFFDAVESDNGLKFIMRGGDKVATIIEDDMMAGIDQPADGDPSTIVRGQEVELPQSVSVSYADWNSDYQISSEMVQRQVTPSVNKVSTELPIAMSADQAARIADVWMYQAWSERTQLAFKVGAKHMKLEPTDVIEVQTAGQTFKARITGKTDDRGVIGISAVVDSGRYTSNATGSSNLGSQTNIAIQSPSLVFLLDSPIITDADNDAGIYASLIPEAVLSDSVVWGGATLMVNEGGTSDVIHTVSSVGNPATCIGSVQAAVAKPVGRANIIDQSYTITVKTNGRPMDSISREQLFNHNNLFAVVNTQAGVVQELLQFQTAEETAEDTYRLSGILRGRFGTDSQIDAIAAGAYLVQLNPRNAILRVPGMPAQIGQEFAYKAVTNGSTVENAQTVRYANTARGLKPYAPVRLNGRRVGNDWHLRWTRRSRIDGGWRNNVDVPLGEAIEEYNLTIPDKRVAIVSTPAFIYTEAMQIADFGSVRTSLTFTVAQVSAAVGAGVLASWSSL